MGAFDRSLYDYVKMLRADLTVTGRDYYNDSWWKNEIHYISFKFNFITIYNDY